MLNQKDTRIRNLVRFDVRLSGNSTVVSQIGILEDFSSRTFANEREQIESFLIDLLQSGVPPKTEPMGRVRVSTQRELPELLARVHQQILGRKKVWDMEGIRARQGVIAALIQLGLLTSPVLPMSTALLAHSRTYERSADDLETLGGVLIRAIDDGMRIGDTVGTAVLGVSERWRCALAPKSGTVLAKALDLVTARSGLIASDLILLTGANKSNVYRAIDEMELFGALVEVTGRKKGQLWLAPELIALTKRAVDGVMKSKG